jgi:hypothetical protein
LRRRYGRRGRSSDARELFAQAWAIRRDDYEASIAAHFVARHQDTPEEALRWNMLAVAMMEMKKIDIARIDAARRG